MKNKKGFTLVELMIVICVFAVFGSIISIGFAALGGKLPNQMVMNGTICENGLVFSVSQGYRNQVIGANGLPQTCQ